MVRYNRVAAGKDYRYGAYGKTMSEVGNWATARVAPTREDVGLWKTRNHRGSELRFLTPGFGAPTYGADRRSGRWGHLPRTRRCCTI
jgi:hypothetical protein